MGNLFGCSEIEVDAATLCFHGNLQRVARKHRIGIEHLLRRSPLVLAVRTNAENLHLVTNRLKLVLRHDHLLQSFQFRAEELDGAIAVNTNNVVVVWAVVDVFEAGPSILKIGLTRQATIRESLKGTEH